MEATDVPRRQRPILGLTVGTIQGFVVAPASLLLTNLLDDLYRLYHPRSVLPPKASMPFSEWTAIVFPFILLLVNLLRRKWMTVVGNVVGIIVFYLSVVVLMWLVGYRG